MPKVVVTGGSGFIGRHLVPHLQSAGHAVVNVDIAAPPEPNQQVCWCQASILDEASLKRVFFEVRPDAVIHLAAHAEMDGRSLADFAANTEGTANVLDAVRAIGGVGRLVVTSTQHVRRPGSGPATHDEDYAPHGLYGESKVVAEKLTRRAGLPGHWAIIRPTAVWGPHHPHQVEGMWRMMYRRRYIHPLHDPVVRNYGYVGNVAWQIGRILALPAEATHARTLYLGDENMRQLDWVNAFSRALTGRDVRTIPLWCIQALAVVGDGLRAAGFDFPMYRSRYFNLVTSNPVPVEATLALLGRGPWTFASGIAETADWLLKYYCRVVGTGNTP